MGSFTIAVGEHSEVVIAVQHLKLPPPHRSRWRESEESLHFLFFFFKSYCIRLKLSAYQLLSVCTGSTCVCVYTLCVYALSCVGVLWKK